MSDEHGENGGYKGADHAYPVGAKTGWREGVAHSDETSLRLYAQENALPWSDPVLAATVGGVRVWLVSERYVIVNHGCSSDYPVASFMDGDDDLLGAHGIALRHIGWMALVEGRLNGV